MAKSLIKFAVPGGKIATEMQRLVDRVVTESKSIAAKPEEHHDQS